MGKHSFTIVTKYSGVTPKDFTAENGSWQTMEVAKFLAESASFNLYEFLGEHKLDWIKNDRESALPTPEDKIDDEYDDECGQFLAMAAIDAMKQKHGQFFTVFN